MSKNTSTNLDQKLSDGTIVVLPKDRKRGENIDVFIDKTIGEPGTDRREHFESDLKIEIFQELIRAARKKRNLSQEELGNLIGVKKAQISKLEKGYNNISIAALSKIFRALNATIKVTVEIDGKNLILRQ
jgi:HTH-type transcriptional regulator/antitoxin HipB